MRRGLHLIDSLARVRQVALEGVSREQQLFIEEQVTQSAERAVAVTIYSQKKKKRTRCRRALP